MIMALLNQVNSWKCWEYYTGTVDSDFDGINLNGYHCEMIQCDKGCGQFPIVVILANGYSTRNDSLMREEGSSTPCCISYDVYTSAFNQWPLLLNWQLTLLTSRQKVMY